MGLINHLFVFSTGRNRLALLFALLGFLWSLAIFCGLTLVEALFILHVGSTSLPSVYLSIGCGMLAISVFFLYGVHTFNPKQIFCGFLIGAILYYGSVNFLIGHFGDLLPKVFWTTLFVLSYMFYLTLTTAFWNLVDSFFNRHQARQLYSLLNAMTFLGVAGGGLLIRLHFFDLSGLLWTICALLTSALLWVGYIFMTQTSLPLEEKQEASTKNVHSLRSIVYSFSTCRFTLFLLFNAFILQILYMTTDYSALAGFESYFSQKPLAPLGNEAHAQLTLYMGQCTLFTCIGTLLFGLFIYNRLMNKVGVRNMIPLIPIIYLLVFASWSVASPLAVATFAFVMTEGFLDIFKENTFNVMLSTVEAEYRPHVRVTIDSILQPLGIIASAGLLQLFQNTPHQLGFVLAIIALCVAMGTRHAYQRATKRRSHTIQLKAAYSAKPQEELTA